MTYGIVGKFSAESGRRDQLLEHLLRAAELLEANPDCIHYVVSTAEDPDAVWVSEVWTDRFAHEASLEHKDIRALIERARPLIAGVSDRVELTVCGGKGLRR